MHLEHETHENSDKYCHVLGQHVGKRSAAAKVLIKEGKCYCFITLEAICDWMKILHSPFLVRTIIDETTEAAHSHKRCIPPL